MDKAPIEVLLDRVEWEAYESVPLPNSDRLPYVTHHGILDIGETKLQCYQLNTGQRVFDAEDVEGLFGGGASDGR